MEVSWQSQTQLTGQARSPEGGDSKNLQPARLYLTSALYSCQYQHARRDVKGPGIRQVLCEGIATLAFQIRERAQIFKMLYTG